MDSDPQLFSVRLGAQSGSRARAVSENLTIPMVMNCLKFAIWSAAYM
jgi:hypothetical protein